MTLHRSTGEILFKMMYSREARTPEDLQFLDPVDRGSSTDHTTTLAEKLLEIYKRAKLHDTKRRTQSNRYYKKRKKPKQLNYQIGNLVWYDFRTKGKSTNNLIDRWVGPYQIIRRTNLSIYQVQNIIDNNVMNNFHHQLLKKFVG